MFNFIKYSYVIYLFVFSEVRCKLQSLADHCVGLKWLFLRRLPYKA